jgi:hypothetical protein
MSCLLVTGKMKQVPRCVTKIALVMFTISNEPFVVLRTSVRSVHLSPLAFSEQNSIRLGVDVQISAISLGLLKSIDMHAHARSHTHTHTRAFTDNFTQR